MYIGPYNPLYIVDLDSKKADETLIKGMNHRETPRKSQNVKSRGDGIIEM